MFNLIRIFLACLVFTEANAALKPGECADTINGAGSKLANKPSFVSYLREHKAELDEKVFERNGTRINAFWGGLDSVTYSTAPFTSLEVMQGLFLFALSRNLDPHGAQHKSTTEFLHAVFRSEVNIIEALVKCENLAQCIDTINDFFRKTTRKHDGRCQQSRDQSHGNDQMQDRMYGNSSYIPSPYDRLDGESKQSIEKHIKEKIGLLFKPGLSTLGGDRPYDMLQNLFRGIATINIGTTAAHGMSFFPLASLIHDMFHYHDVRDTHRSALTMLIKQRIDQKMQHAVAVEFAVEQAIHEVMNEYQTFCEKLSTFLECHKDDRMVLTALFELFHEGELRRNGLDVFQHMNSLPKFFKECADRVTKREGNRDNDEYSSSDPLMTHTGRSSLPDAELTAIALRKLQHKYPSLDTSYAVEIVQTDTHILARYSHPKIYGRRTEILGRTLQSKLDNAYDLWRLLGWDNSGLQDPKGINNTK
ncbi:MAG: hypothetical protein WCN27_04745, partial [Alphaproteobacteria bacterium]